ncbi:MAG: hypothetical protein H7326_02485 [Bdellovibrionaceae bacterium]|nr:hypothetical protein [Pseudobdellovibrionaceae bacterium]
MKFALAFVSVLFAATAAFAADNSLVGHYKSGPTLENTLAFNFVGLAQGRPNIYLDIGGLSSFIAPSISFKTYSTQENRKDLDNAKATADRTLAGIGPSVTVLRADKKSLILNPYIFFGTEKDAKSTNNVSGPGLRALGQVNFTKSVALQGGLDGNNMEGPFKAEAYIGFGMTL